MNTFPNCKPCPKIFIRFAGLLALFFIMGCNSHSHKAHSHSAHEVELTQKIELSGKTKNGNFLVHLSTVNKSAVQIGHYQDWSIKLMDNDDAPIQATSIAVSGGMPSHGHALPSAPEVSQYLGEGNHLVEGMLFTMGGEWLLRLNITAEGVNDVVDFAFSINS